MTPARTCGDRRCGADAALTLGVHVAAAIVGAERPLVQDLAAVAHRFLGPHVGRGDVAVEGHADLEAESTHTALIVLPSSLTEPVKRRAKSRGVSSGRSRSRVHLRSSRTGRSWSTSLDDAVVQVSGPAGRDGVELFELQVLAEAFEHALPIPEEHRGDVHDEFVDQARGQVLLPQGGPAHHADVPFPGGLACLGQSVLDPAGHEVYRRCRLERPSRAHE